MISKHLLDQLWSDLAADNSRGEADVYAVGSGTEGPSQLTVESLRALAKSNTVFGFSEISHLRPLLVGLGCTFVELPYGPVQSREEIFRSAAAQITQQAMNNPPVCWLVAGSPVRHVWLTQVLRAWTKREGLRFRVLLAPSFLDTMLDLLGVDDSAGLQLYDAATLVVYGQSPTPTVPCFVFNPNKAFTDRSCYMSSPRPEMLIPIQEQLLKIYSKDHPIKSVIISRDQTMVVEEISLSLLSTLAYRELGTLFIPAVELGMRPSENLSDLHSLRNLVRVAATPCDAILGSAALSLSNLLRE